MRYLVIIDALGKASTLTAALDDLGLDDFEIFPTRGHIMAMPDGLWPIGIDAGLFETHRKVRDPKLIARMRDRAAQASEVLVASDADQEGDVLAWDIAQILAKHPKVRRVRLRSLDSDGVRDAFCRYEPINERDSWPGTARRILDRVIGASFTQTSENYDDGVGVGRVQSALLGALAAEPQPFAMATAVLPAADHFGHFSAQIPVFPGNEKEVRDLVDASIRHAGRGAVAGQPEPAQAFLPWNYGQAVLAISDVTGRQIEDVAYSMQRLYESGRMSYPRATTEAVTGDALACLSRISDEHMIRFDTAKVSQFARKGRHAHEAPRPTTVDVDICAPILLLGSDDAALSLIARHLIACGQPRFVERPKVETIPEWALGVNWQRRRSTWLRPWPCKIQVSNIAIRSVESVALRTMVERKLGRPSAIISHAKRFAARGLLDDRMQLTEKARNWLESTPSILANPDTSARIEAALNNSADERDMPDPPQALIRNILGGIGLWTEVKEHLGSDFVPPSRREPMSAHPSSGSTIASQTA